ncbi:hypothetical protein SDC9_112605 [bioreactor metagenome]|uniref:Uncharacterized protein n=1 Tax=bioreactor metagenome TaxID=1076179 RepID=A0A645BK13_9ZZZZ
MALHRDEGVKILLLPGARSAGQGMMVYLVIFQRGAQTVEGKWFDEKFKNSRAERLADKLRVFPRGDDDIVGA